jgi:hypothetical protein
LRVSGSYLPTFLPNSGNGKKAIQWYFESFKFVKKAKKVDTCPTEHAVPVTSLAQEKRYRTNVLFSYRHSRETINPSNPQYSAIELLEQILQTPQSLVKEVDIEI